MKPMMALALKHEDIERKTDSEWLCEPKLDGMRLLLHFPRGKLTEALTRSERDVLPQVPDLWKEHAGPDLSDFWHRTGFEWLDCEFGYLDTFVGASFGTMITTANLDFNKTMRVMGSGSDEAQRKAAVFYGDENDAPEAGVEVPLANIFDIPDCELPLWERRQILETTEDFQAVYGYWGSSWGMIIPQWKGWSERLYDYIVQNGGEGVMLKNPGSPYLPGKRVANTWYKVKKFDTVDMYVVGFDPGQGKYEGLIGAIVCQTQDGMEIRCSGMTDDERIRISARQERVIREQWVAEVKYFGLTAGTPRHPQFLRWREDKTAAECYFNQ